MCFHFYSAGYKIIQTDEMKLKFLIDFCCTMFLNIDVLKKDVSFKRFIIEVKTPEDSSALYTIQFNTWIVFGCVLL